MRTGKKMKRLLSLALAAVMTVGILSGCGAGQDGMPDGTGSSGLTDAEQERQDAIDRANEQAMQDAQEEQDNKTGNTKPYITDRADSPNKGDGGGMSGLDDDPVDTDTGGGETGSDNNDGPAGGMYADDGNKVIPEGMPELTMAALGVPEWSGQPWAVLNNGTPYFTAPEGMPRVSETYSSLDKQRRPGCALVIVQYRCEEKPDYSFEIKAGTLSVPGWNEDTYPGVVRDLDPSLVASGSPASGKLLYMRRLVGSGIGWSEIGRRNSIVCTEYMGEYGLKSLEQMVQTYLKKFETPGSGKRRVIYRVTPVFEGDEILARGVVVEAMSCGDSEAEIVAGRDLCFNMFVYNVQPGVKINYKTGETSFDDSYDTSTSTTMCGVYALDTSRKEAHMPWCDMLVRDVHPMVLSYYYGTLESVAAWSLDWNSCGCMDAGAVPNNDNSTPEDQDEDPPAGDGMSDWESQMGVQP